jgi:hypothetical protein
MVEDAFVAVTDNKWETKWSHYGTSEKRTQNCMNFYSAILDDVISRGVED